MNSIFLCFAAFWLMASQLSAQHVYFTDRKEAIVKFSPENPEPTPIYESYEYAISGLAVDRNAEWLYGMLDTEKLFRIRPDGSEMEVLAEFDTDSFGGAVIEVALDDANHIIYILGSTTLLQYNLQTGQLKPLVYETDRYNLSPNRIALSDSFVYWSSRYEDLENGVIRRMAKNSKTPSTIVPAKFCYFVEALTLVEGNLYWIASPGGPNAPPQSAIYRARSDGSNPRIFYAPKSESLMPAGELVHYQNYLYYEALYEGIRKINLAGGVASFVKIDFNVDYMLILP